MSFKFFDKLSQDFSELLKDKKEYNVVIEVDKGENMKTFTTHSVVLRYRSSYFDKELENAPTNENHIKTIIKPNISAQIFEIILKYIYGGIVNIENTETKTIYELMVNANELELKELSVKLESHLIESKASWLKTHFSLIYRSIFDSTEFNGLKKFYNDIIAKYPNLIFESENFTSLQETALVSILARDDLKFEEIKIWDYVIKWGIAQNPSLPTNLQEWSNENFEALKITLRQCLPLIRYFHIPVEIIWKKMKPYKKILEEQLWDDIIQHSKSPIEPITSLALPARIISNPELPSRAISTPELPPKIKETFSTTINSEHVAELSSWIDRKSTIYSLANIPYEFQLILRGSRDGFHPKTFWNMCHGHAGTIVVVKVAGTDEIVGGYNPLAWDNLKSGWMKTNDSFIFSLKNGNVQNSILGRVKNSINALNYYNSKNIYGPEFGNCEFMMKSDVSDFTQDKQCWCWDGENYYNCYEKSIRTTNKTFSISDYELDRKLHLPLPVLITSFSFFLDLDNSITYIYNCHKYIYGEIVDIENMGTKAICELMDLIFDNNDFEDLKRVKETALISILNRDDLKVEEIKIWDYVIKWGIAQNSTLPADSKEWSNENFKALKITLQQCLPLIRYFYIPARLFGRKIISNLESPSRTVSTFELPKHVAEFSPPSVTGPFSNLINKEYAAELSSWIDRKSITNSLTNIPYEFHLILRGSRDGFHPKTFWNMRHGHVGTIVLVKVARTDEIVGGYNPLAVLECIQIMRDHRSRRYLMWYDGNSVENVWRGNDGNDGVVQ
ncbi:hypothetical protein Glove_87g146 [Diversispora epigaea]|uniref:BTB domain-containing protein n=1 Tax=Diversispora epigaea TaxID=1348612 RepID=A0A397J8F5_9GLOM|nr:hypothetical protein Glove_87g146 [Diversispora epigaea]